MKFLILACRFGKFCELEYGSCVATGIIVPILKNLGHEVKVVESPNPAEANEAIKQFDPDVVWWNGHGAPSATSLERLSIWISDEEHCGGDFGNANRYVLSGRIANALSCLTASCLGRDLTERFGCLYYLGYTGRFWFVWGGCAPSCACGRFNPHPVEIREFVNRWCLISMHESNLYFLVGLAKGFTPAQAHAYSLKRFEQWIKALESIEPKSKQEASLIASTVRILEIDRKIQVLCHEGRYLSPEKPPEDPPPIPLPGKGTLRVLSKPEGAKVYVGEKYRCNTPCELELDPGEYVVRVELPGYVPLARKVRVAEGKVTVVRFVLGRRKSVIMVAPLILSPLIMCYGFGRG